MNDTRVYFGLDKATKVDHVEIRWRSGAVEVLKDRPADASTASLRARGIAPPEKIRPVASAPSKCEPINPGLELAISS
jgi:hypothetical protein